MTHTSNGLARIGLIGLVLAALAIAPATMAKTTAGNNGTVKIHDDGASETSPVTRNEPHVGCDFHMHFLFADDDQSGDWQIVAWSPTGSKSGVAASGMYDTEGDGEAIVEGPSLMRRPLQAVLGRRQRQGTQAQGLLGPGRLWWRRRRRVRRSVDPRCRSANDPRPVPGVVACRGVARPAGLEPTTFRSAT